MIAREQGKIISLDKAIEDGIPLEEEISRNEENLEDVIIRQLMIEKMMACLPLLPEYDRIPFIVYYQGGKVEKATSGIQSKEQIAININELFLKTEKV